MGKTLDACLRQVTTEADVDIEGLIKNADFKLFGYCLKLLH